MLSTGIITTASAPASSLFCWLLSLRMLLSWGRLEIPICRWSSYPLQLGTSFTCIYMASIPRGRYIKAGSFLQKSCTFLTCQKKCTDIHYKTFKNVNYKETGTCLGFRLISQSVHHHFSLGSVLSTGRLPNLRQILQTRFN